MQIIYDGRKVQVWEFVSQGLNIGKWSTGKHCDGVVVVKKRENHYAYCFDAATATGAPLVANRRTISYGRPPAVAHGPSVTLF